MTTKSLDIHQRGFPSRSVSSLREKSYHPTGDLGSIDSVDDEVFYVGLWDDLNDKELFHPDDEDDLEVKPRQNDVSVELNRETSREDEKGGTSVLQGSDFETKNNLKYHVGIIWRPFK